VPSASAQQGMALLRASTDAYIADDPTTIIFIVDQMVEKPGGGMERSDTPGFTPAQTFKLIAQDSGNGIQTVSDDGKARQFDYIIVGRHDADIKIGYRWADGGNWYRVTGIAPFNGYEIKATATGLGDDPNYG